MKLPLLVVFGLICLLSFPPESAADDGTFVMPFEIDAEHIVVRGRVGKAKTRFIVDTGAGGTIIERFVAEHAGLPIPKSQKQTFQGINSEMNMKKATLPEVVLGSLTLTDVPVHIHNPRIMTLGPGGILGMDILGRYALTLDFEKKQLTLSKQSPPVPPNSVSLTLEPITEHPYLTGIINGSTSEIFLLDTGSPWPLFLHEQEATRAGLLTGEGKVAPHADVKKKKIVIDANIAIRDAPRVKLKTLDIGTIRLVDVDAAIIKSSSGGGRPPNLIGLPFIQKFASATFDFPNQQLILKRKSTPKAAAPTEDSK